ncbi:MAG: GYD domain-containing protein [Phycisphaerales bacterium]|nr:GYD domain-containing protein [Phycisphaerales bacterium]
MSKYVVLAKFTEKGLANIRQSPDRAVDFRAAAEKAGVKVETQLWTAGPYDGLLILDAPDETTAAGAVLGLSNAGNISTCMLRAFDAHEFKAVVGKMV